VAKITKDFFKTPPSYEGFTSFGFLYPMKLIPVVCAIFISDSRVLAVRRSNKMTLTGFWEFPGGKIEKGESEEESLKREIQEELNLTIEVGESLTPTEYSYEDGKVIRLIPFLVREFSGGFRLAEHDDLAWLGLNELLNVNWAQADIPIVKELIKNWEEINKQS